VSVNLCVSDWDENLTEDQARKAYDKMLKIEEEFGDLFTGLMLSVIVMPYRHHQTSSVIRTLFKCVLVQLLHKWLVVYFEEIIQVYGCIPN